MTYLQIGNYGINNEDDESARPYLEGFVVKECSRIVSNWRAKSSLPDYLKKHGVVGIEGVDTRELTKHIRSAGAKKAVISTKDLDRNRLVKKAKASRGLIGVDLVDKVSCRKSYEWNRSGKYKVVVIDCGAKFNIMRILENMGCHVRVVPARTTAQEIISLKPNGVMLSNGPGDPAAVTYVIETVKQLVNRKMAIFGICLGHQMLGLALGGRTFKLKFGHRGGNQPVMDLRTGKVDITSQNHGFCVDIRSLDKDDVEITHVNLNDGTLEGIKHRKLPVFSVQFHPEHCPGPHDSEYLFREFKRMMGDHAKKK